MHTETGAVAVNPNVRIQYPLLPASEIALSTLVGRPLVRLFVRVQVRQ